VATQTALHTLLGKLRNQVRKREGGREGRRGRTWGGGGEKTETTKTPNCTELSLLSIDSFTGGAFRNPAPLSSSLKTDFVFSSLEIPNVGFLECYLKTSYSFALTLFSVLSRGCECSNLTDRRRGIHSLLDVVALELKTMVI
jgi:hypothetical protein